MKIIRGGVRETIVVVKEVEVEVSDNAEEDEIRTALREKAYEETLQDMTGWELSETLDVDVYQEE